MDTILAPFRAMRELISQHKKKVVGGTIVCAGVGGYYLYKRFRPLYDHVRSELKMMEQLTKQMADSEQQAKLQALIQRFNHSLSVADVTVSNFALQIRNELKNRFDVESLRTQMKRDGGSKTRTEQDYRLWDDFKILAFTRTLACIYSVVCLHALIKVQLSVASRYVVNDDFRKNNSQNNISMENTNSSSDFILPLSPPLSGGVSELVSKHYFSLSAHAQTGGIIELSRLIEKIVREEMNKWQLSALSDREQIHDTLNTIKRRIYNECPSIFPSSCASSSSSSSSPSSLSSSSSSSSISCSSTPSPFLSLLFPNPSTIIPTLTQIRLISGGNSNTTSTNTNTNTNTPNPDEEAIALSRLRDMIEETWLIFNTNSFSNALNKSIDLAFESLFEQLDPVFVPSPQQQKLQASSSQLNGSPNPAEQGLSSPGEDSTSASKNESASAAVNSVSAVTSNNTPFANVMVRMIKIFTNFLPEPPAPQSDSPLIQSLGRNHLLKELCEVIFYPLKQLDDIHKPIQPAQQMALPGLNDLMNMANLPEIAQQIEGLPQITAL